MLKEQTERTMIRLYYRLEKNWGGTHKGLPLFKKIGQKCHTPQPILDHGIASCRRPPPRDGDARNASRRNRERCPRWAAGGRRSRGRPADPNRAPPPPPPPCGVGATRRRVARRTPSPSRCRESPPSTPARRQAHRDEAEPCPTTPVETASTRTRPGGTSSSMVPRRPTRLLLLQPGAFTTALCQV